MKAKLLLIAMLLAGISSGFYAQNANQKKTQTLYAKGGAGDNWFVEAGGGLQTTFGNSSDKTTFSQPFTPAIEIAAGKWFTPDWGFRLKGQGVQLKSKGYCFYYDTPITSTADFFDIHVDALWNASNFFYGYSQQRKINIVPYIGLGFGHAKRYASYDNYAGSNPTDKSKINALTVHGGIQANVALSRQVSLNLDLGLTVVPDGFSGISSYNPYDYIAAATIGFVYHFGKTTFDAFLPCPSEDVEALNKTVNRMRKESEILSLRPESCPECPKIPIAAPEISGDIELIPNVVFFGINSAKIDDDQQASIHSTARFLKESGSKIRVTGYADRETGSNDYNRRLSEKRARAVANELISKHGIASQKVTVEWKGAEQQPYAENKWNRIVIMSAE